MEANVELAVYRGTQISGGIDQRTRLVGLFANRGRELNGCASGVLDSNKSDSALVVSVPTGFPIPANWPSAGDWDMDGSYADWYTGHELAHTFGFRHLHHCGAPSASSPPDWDPDPFDGKISDAQGSYAGLDVGLLGPSIPGANNAELILRPLPGTEWHDIRTYCDKRWISSTVYEWIREALDLENPDTVPPVSPVNLRILKIDKTVNRLEATNSESPVRILPITFHNPLESQRKPQRNTFLVDSDSVSRLKPSGVSGVTVHEGDFLAVVATVNLTQKTAAFRWTARVGRAEIMPEVAQAEATLHLFDDHEQVLAKKSIIIRRNMRMKKDDDETGLIYDAIALPPNKTFKSLKLFLAGKPEPVAVLPISKAPPRVLPASPPFQTIEYQAGQVRLQWGAEDPDTDTKDLSYTIEISFDQGGTWHTLAAGRSKQQMVIRLNELKVLSGREVNTLREAQIKVIASDGFNNSAAMIEKLDLGRINN